MDYQPDVNPIIIGLHLLVENKKLEMAFYSSKQPAEIHRILLNLRKCLLVVEKRCLSSETILDLKAHINLRVK